MGRSLAQVHGRSVDLLRAETARRAREERDARRRTAPPEDLERAVVDLSEAEAVRTALASLSDAERTAIELAYFGEDPKRWPEMVIPGHVTRGDIPVLFTTAEWDNARYLWPQAAVYKELIDRHGARPRYRQSLGHNHSSQLLSVGTADTSVSREIVDFIESTVKR